MVVFAVLSDCLPVRRTFLAGAGFTVAFAFPLFLLFDSGDMALMIVAFAVALVLGHATTYAVVSSMTADLFPTSVRYSGAALCNAFAGVAWVAPTPLVAAALVPADGSNHWWPLPSLLMLSAAISIVSASTTRTPAPTDRLHGREAATSSTDGGRVFAEEPA